MEERQKEKKTLSAKKKRAFIAIGSFLILCVAIAGVTMLAATWGKKVISPKQPAEVVVHITKNGFEPATVSVNKGTKVTWTNDDQSLHQVVANPYPRGTDLPNLKSEILNDSQSYTYTANTAGTFGYHDQMHPTINGTLVVEKQ